MLYLIHFSYPRCVWRHGDIAAHSALVPPLSTNCNTTFILTESLIYEGCSCMRLWIALQMFSLRADVAGQWEMRADTAAQWGAGGVMSVWSWLASCWFWHTVQCTWWESDHEGVTSLLDNDIQHWLWGHMYVVPRKLHYYRTSLHLSWQMPAIIHVAASRGCLTCHQIRLALVIDYWPFKYNFRFSIKYSPNISYFFGLHRKFANVSFICPGWFFFLKTFHLYCNVLYCRLSVRDGNLYPLVILLWCNKREKRVRYLRCLLSHSIIVL